jgi:UTP---glucose-1-phosphate uridylyltransferase
MELAATLEKVQRFYDSLGGIVGYQVKCLELIDAALEEELSGGESDGSGGSTVEFLIPQGTNLQGPEQRATAQQAAADGLHAMPMLAEIYPLGGAPLHTFRDLPPCGMCTPRSSSCASCSDTPDFPPGLTVV